jgi:hypothetical protein
VPKIGGTSVSFVVRAFQAGLADFFALTLINTLEAINKMEDYVSSINKLYVREVSKAALEYLKVGLSLFHKQQKYYYSQPQIPLGILSISIELMLKTFILSNSFTVLFKDIPLELRLLLTSPSNIPGSFRWRKYDIDLKSFSYKTLELEEVISCFFILRPDLKQQFKSHLRFLSKYRNASIHLALPSFQKYELDRTAFLALEILKVVKDIELSSFAWHPLSEQDKRFLATFQEERIERVRKIIEKSQIQSRTIEHDQSYISDNDWDTYVISCPICGNDSILNGYTELKYDQDEDGDFSPYLEFYADSFECEECGLSLKDIDELKLAGMDIILDRADDTEKWLGEMGDDY